MKICTLCLESKSEDQFYGLIERKRGPGRCKACEDKARNLKRRANLKGDAAKAMAAHGVRTGKIKKETICSACGETKPLDKHHEDYSKPLDITWLCRKCHCQLHASKK